MKKIVGVCLLLVVACTAFAEIDNSQIVAKCLGMAAELKLTEDRRLFDALLGLEQDPIKEKYGINSERYLALLRYNAELTGYGSGYAAGLLQNQGQVFLFELFVTTCYDGKHAVRESLLTKLRSIPIE